MAKKKIKWWKAIAATLLFVVAIYSVFYYHKQITRYYFKAYRLYKRTHRKAPTKSFESVPFPEAYNIHGIDISHYQEDINWDRLQTSSTEPGTP